MPDNINQQSLLTPTTGQNPQQTQNHDLKYHYETLDKKLSEMYFRQNCFFQALFDLLKPPYENSRMSVVFCSLNEFDSAAAIASKTLHVLKEAFDQVKQKTLADPNNENTQILKRILVLLDKKMNWYLNNIQNLSNNASQNIQYMQYAIKIWNDTCNANPHYKKIFSLENILNALSNALFRLYKDAKTIIPPSVLQQPVVTNITPQSSTAPITFSIDRILSPNLQSKTTTMPNNFTTQTCQETTSDNRVKIHSHCMPQVPLPFLQQKDHQHSLPSSSASHANNTTVAQNPNDRSIQDTTNCPNEFVDMSSAIEKKYGRQAAIAWYKMSLYAKSATSNNPLQQNSQHENKDAQILNSPTKTFLHPQQDKIDTAKQDAKKIKIVQQPNLSKLDEAQKPIRQSNPLLNRLLSEEEEENLPDCKICNITLKINAEYLSSSALKEKPINPVKHHHDATMLNASATPQVFNAISLSPNSPSTQDRSDANNHDILQPACNLAGIASQNTTNAHATPLHQVPAQNMSSATHLHPAIQARAKMKNQPEHRYHPYKNHSDQTNTR